MKRILIADDNAANRELVREILYSQGYEVIEAHNGAEALAKLLESKPDLALVDLQMPEMDGLTLVRCIRDDPRISDLRVLAITAYAMRGDRERTLNSGFDGYVTKPFEIATLTGELRRFLGE